MKRNTDRTTFAVAVDTRANAVCLTFDCRLYPTDILMSAAYVFLGRAYLQLNREGERCVRVTVKGKQKHTRGELLALAGEFQNELVDQHVRARLAREHTKLREMIVGRALYGAQGTLVSPQPLAVPNDDYLADPLGIAVPWEERFLSNREKKSAAESPAAASAIAPDVPASALRRGPGPEKWTEQQDTVSFDDTSSPPDWPKK